MQDEPGRETYRDIARAEIAFFDWLGRQLVALWRVAGELTLQTRARVEGWLTKKAADWRLLMRWLELASKAKGEGQHIEMAMTQNLLAPTLLNPFKLISAALAVLVVALAGLLGWQWVRADLAEAKVEALTEKNRTAVERSWQWKAQADARAKALQDASDAIALNGRVRAAENDRSLALARDTARRSAALAKRQRERMADALATQSRDTDSPVDLDSRLRELAAPSAAAGGDPVAAAPGGDPAAGVPARAGADAEPQPAAAAAGPAGSGEDPPRGGILGSARPPG